MGLQGIKGTPLLIYSTLTHPLLHYPNTTTTMCYREVQFAKHVCDCEEAFSETKIDCNSNRCRYSSLHPRGCATCVATCIQNLGPHRRVVTQRKDSLCYHCKRNASRACR